MASCPAGCAGARDVGGRRSGDWERRKGQPLKPPAAAAAGAWGPVACWENQLRAGSGGT